MLGDIDTNGSLNAQIIHQLTDRIRGKMVVQVRTCVSYTGNPPYGKTTAVVHFATISCEPCTAHKVQGKPMFCIICPCANDIVYAWLKIIVKTNFSVHFYSYG